MNLKYIKKQLKKVHLKYESRNPRRIQKNLDKVKKQAVKENDQNLAKEIWCFEQILKIQEIYIDTYKKFKSGNFYNGWCSLERFEIEYSFLFRHFKEQNSEYKLEFMNKHVSQYQSIFPYNCFQSPEYLKKEVKCSICNHIINIRNPCSHRKGEIYDGEMCTHIITKPLILGSSFVKSPGQKYSVVFKSDPKTREIIDHYNYSMVKFVIDRLQSPFHNWDIEWTKKRHPHLKYKHIGKNDECPCESGKKYKDCCLSKSGVLRPHCQIIFSVVPPEELSMFEYTD